MSLFSDPIRAAEMAFERAAEAAARAALQEEQEEEEKEEKPILPYSSYFIFSSTNPWVILASSNSPKGVPMETLIFALLKLSIFLPHQTFHITTPLEVDFGSVQG